MTLFEHSQPSWTERYSGSQHERINDLRTPYQRDRARILHSAAFRRLQAKNQVLGVGQNDFYRTRLTHSLEVSQIGASLLEQLIAKSSELVDVLPNTQLIESLCLAHDIGHPPFGHGGEMALNAKMQPFGHFEGNAQTFRIVSALEPYTESHGMDLTRRTVLGLVKYPALLHHLSTSDTRAVNARYNKPVKGIYTCDQPVFDWLLAPFIEDDIALFTEFVVHDGYPKTIYKSLDASIMELADDIAYAVHDLEDGIVSGNISKSQWYDIALPNITNTLNAAELVNELQAISTALFSEETHTQKRATGSLVNLLVTAVYLGESNSAFKEPLLKWNAKLPTPHQIILDELKRFVFSQVIQKPELQRIEFKGQRIVSELFDAFSAYPERLLPKSTRARWIKSQQHSKDSDASAHRVICDYLSGMTDEYAIKMYRNMFQA